MGPRGMGACPSDPQRNTPRGLRPGGEAAGEVQLCEFRGKYSGGCAEARGVAGEVIMMPIRETRIEYDEGYVPGREDWDGGVDPDWSME